MKTSKQSVSSEKVVLEITEEELQDTMAIESAKLIHKLVDDIECPDDFSRVMLLTTLLARHTSNVLEKLFKKEEEK